jgi:tetratricopeptide (TPR) repeat protein
VKYTFGWLKTDTASVTAVFALLLGLYTVTLAPSVEVRDAAELATASYTLGIAHPPGSPLYCLAGKVFSVLLPIGSAAFRYNLFSALCGALTAAGLFLLARRLGASAPAASIGALLLGVSLAFWSATAGAGVHTLSTLLLLAALWAFWRLEHEPTTKRFACFGLAWGLLLSNHTGFSLLVPLLLLTVGWRLWKKTPPPGAEPPVVARQNHLPSLGRALGVAAAFLALGLSFYAYLPLRSATDPELDWGNPETLRNWVEHVTAKPSRERWFALSAGEYADRGWEYLRLLRRQVTEAGFALAVLGIVGLRTAAPLFASALGLVFLWDGFSATFLDTAPLASKPYGIPSTLVLALWAACFPLGLRRLAPRLAPYLGPWQVLALVLPLAIAIWNFPHADRSGNFVVYDNAYEVLHAVEPEGVLLARDDNHVFPLAYMKLVERRRPDVQVVDRDGHVFEPLYEVPLHRTPTAKRLARVKRTEEALFDRVLAEGRPLYATGQQTEYALDTRFQLTPRGPLVRIARQDGPLPDGTFFRMVLRGEESVRSDWTLGAVLSLRALNWGEYLWAIGRLREAKEQFERAGRTESAYPELHFILGQSYLRKGRLEEAERAFETAAGLKPRMGMAWAQLGAVRAQRQKFEAALDALDQAKFHAPEASVVYEYEGNIYRDMKFIPEALEAYRDALALAPSDFRLRFLYADMLAQVGAMREAIQTLEQARAFPAAPTETMVRLAQLYEAVGSLHDAIAMWQRVEERQEMATLEQARFEQERLRALLPP